MNASVAIRALARRALLPALLALSLLGAPAAGAVSIDEFPLGATPTGIAAGPDGNLYVTTTAPSILRVSPAGDVTARYPLTATGTPRPALPTFAGGELWYTLTRYDSTTSTTTGSIGRRATDGTITEFPLPTAGESISSLAAGPDGNVWFTEAGTKAAVGRITPAGLITELTGTSQPPTSIALDSTGQLWVTESGGHVATVSPAGAFAEITTVSTPWKVATSPSSPTVWFAARQGLCCYGPISVDFALWLAPGAPPTPVGAGFLGTAIVQDVAVGPDGNAWMTDKVGPRLGRVATSGRTTVFSQGLAGDAVLGSITDGPGDTLWFTDVNATVGRVGRVRLDRPTVTTEAATNIGQTAAGVGATATPSGTVSRVRFEYGTTTEYGISTRWQEVGDGDAAVARSARLDGLLPGTTYHYRAVLGSSWGMIAGPDRVLTTAPLPPPPPVPPADVDGDGYAISVDCNDSSAATFPGANDVPGDGIDQDCSGQDEAYPRFFPHIVAYYQNKRKRWSRFTDLVVEDVSAGAAVRLRCTGVGCKFKTWTATVRRDTDELDLLKRLKGSKLAPAAVLELQLTLPGYIGTVVRWKVGPPPKPTVTCLVPGAKKDGRC
jgi:virginiamycin B lyase